MAVNPCETSLVDNPPKPNADDTAAPPTNPHEYTPVPQTPPAENNRVAFNIGGSDDTDLDSKEFDTKDLETNGKIDLCGLQRAALYIRQRATLT